MTAEASSDQQESRPPNPPPPKRLLRAREGRLIFGAATGLARYFSIDPVIVRVAFIVGIFFGGVGLFVYLALAVFVPAGDPGATAGGGEAEVGPAPYQEHPWLGVGAGILLLILLVPAVTGDLWNRGPVDNGWIIVPVLVGVAAYLFLSGKRRPETAPAGVADSDAGADFNTDETTVVQAAAPTADDAATPTHEPSNYGKPSTGRNVALGIAGFFGFGIVFVAAVIGTALGSGPLLAVILGGAGVMLVVGGLLGTSRWMVVPVLALAFGVTVAVAADLEVEGGIGDASYRPATASDIPPAGFPLAVGRLVVDLRDLDWDERQVLPLQVSVGAGQAVVIVPENVCVNFDLDTSAGDLVAGGQQVAGMFVTSTSQSGRGEPRLEVDGSVQLGQFLVIADDDLDREAAAGRSRISAPDLEQQRTINQKACAS